MSLYFVINNYLHIIIPETDKTLPSQVQNLIYLSKLD